MPTTEFETDFNVSFYSSYFFLPKDQIWSQTESSIFHVLFRLFERMHFYFIFFFQRKYLSFVITCESSAHMKCFVLLSLENDKK